MSDSPSPTTPIVDGIAAIVDDYDGFVLDTAGVLHDGSTPYPGALDALRHLRSRGKKVCLLTNQARRSASVGRLLDEIGIGADLYDHVLTSGELTHQWLLHRPEDWLQDLHDPNAIDALRFSAAVAFRWVANSEPRRGSRALPG